ncbi:hypothetical protein NFI08_22400 [Halomonas sp. EF61]|uniref:hypothetical protein n=1 Tax=Halomonas sp. EF61 TaxID=2950869 RepID=UPI0032DFFCCC
MKQNSIATLVTEPLDVERRLTAFCLTREGLLRVRDMALGAAADTTPFDPTNAAGTLAYIYGVRGLRFEFVGQGWQLDRVENMEFIKNESLGMRVGFCNVRPTASEAGGPKARSPKGAGAERACQYNLALDFGDAMPNLPTGDKDYSTYFLMVERDGRAELSRPVVKSGNFVDYVERLSISDGSDFELDPTPLLDDGDLDVFDPVVARR